MTRHGAHLCASSEYLSADRWRGGIHNDEGSVTAELAIGMVAVMVMFALILGAGNLSRATIAANAAAVDAAQLAARGESHAVIAERVSGVAGDRASFTVAESSVVIVSVTVPVRILGVGLPTFAARGTGSALKEAG